ncbi:MAG: S41 family peptidase [Planctomycetota bacterium]|jgi:tricorn protease
MSPLRNLCLVLAVALAGTASAEDQPTLGLRYPSLTPDGKSVVFCYRGDIWIAPVDGSRRADRLTIHEQQDTLCRVSPDGKRIAFSSKRNGMYDLFVMPIDGGMPKQITFHSAVEIVCAWSPDGKKLLYMSNRDLGPGRLDLYEVDAEGGPSRRITYDGGREGSYSPDGSRIVYVRGFNSIYWDNYEGSANYDIHVVDAKGGVPRRITDTEGNERFPCFGKDGRTIYYLAEEKNVASFYAIPLEGGKRTQVTKYKKHDVHRPCVNWDHRTAVFEVVGQLYTADLTAPAQKPTPIPLSIRSDVRNSGLEMRTITSGGEQVHVSHDGRQVAFSLRGDIWVMPAGGGNGKRVTSGPEKDEWPRFRPSGTEIAYFSKKQANTDIHILDVKSGRSRAVTRHPGNDFYHSWSPDGKTLVFCSDRSGNREIWTLELETKQLTQITHEPAADDDPSFSPDGKQITFDSGRSGSQAIYVMNADGTDVRRITQGAAFFQVPSFSPDGKMLVYEGASPTGRSGGLHVVSVRGGPSMQISRDGSTACWARTGGWIYFTANRGPHGSGVFRVRAPESVVAGEHVPFVGQVKVDLRKELENLFDEAWMALQSGFYDAKMHGVDWKAAKKKYRAIAIDAENKDEFHNVIRQMLAELGASHLGIGGGDRGNSVSPTVKETGYLGVDFEQEPLEDGARKVARVVAGGPADKAGLRIGDEVLKIGAKKLEAKTNLDQRLAGTVGEKLELTYRPRSAAGLGPERTVELVPLAARQLSDLHYKEWVATCQRRVKEATKTKEGEIGYIHLRAMSPQNLQKFQRAVQGWLKREKLDGMILDIRNNGGGNIHMALMSILTAEPLARVQVRGRAKATQPSLYWNRPVVLLINERSFSDAEVFPYMFKVAKVGTVIGMPTAGGVIGTNDVTLTDGSRFRVPRTGFWGMDGTNLEGLGVKPDIYVEETPEDRLQGRDPQLRKAIEVILEQVKPRRAEREAAKKKKEEPPKKPGQPEPQPADPTAVADARNPLADAQVGEWVRYRLADPVTGDETIAKLSVVRVEGGVVGFAQEIEHGKPVRVPLPDELRQAKVLDLLPVFGQVLSHTMVPAKVREVETDVFQARLKGADGAELLLTFTNLVPGPGLLRVEQGKQVVLEAVEWGREKPAGVIEEKTGEDRALEAPPHPIYDAKEGEWVKLRMIGPGGQEIEMTRRVVVVGEDEITLQVTISFGGNTREGRQARPRSKLLKPLDGSEATYERDTVTVSDTTFECTVMTYTRDNVEERVWVCPKVPVTGVVKVERDGAVVLELIEWGKD